MREHMGLYRGKRTDGKGWAEGYLVDRRYGEVYILSNWYAPVLDWIYFRVVPDTVGECTGLRDKNGKLIFEHQSIKYAGVLYKVRMRRGMWCMFDKWEHYCELYKHAGDSEIVMED